MAHAIPPTRMAHAASEDLRTRIRLFMGVPPFAKRVGKSCAAA